MKRYRLIVDTDENDKVTISILDNERFWNRTETDSSLEEIVYSIEKHLQVDEDGVEMGHWGP